MTSKKPKKVECKCGNCEFAVPLSVDKKQGKVFMSGKRISWRDSPCDDWTKIKK